MKKVITMIGLFCISMVVLSGCSAKQTDFTEKNYTVDSTQIQSINIDAIDRKIDVELSDDDQIYIDYYESEQEFFNIAVSDDHTLTMSYDTQNNGQITLVEMHPCRIVPSAYEFLKIYYLH